MSRRYGVSEFVCSVFHGDATGDLNEAQKEMMLAHSVLKDQAHEGGRNE